MYIEQGRKKTSSFNQAKEFLSKEKHVVITGVQGSGKTFLANRLIDDLKKNKNIIKVAWISNQIQLSQEQKGQIRRTHIYVFDGIFYELQTYRKFKDTLKDLEFFLESTEKPYLIITSPSFIWLNHAKSDGFKERFREVNVDLDNRNESEKQEILKSLMKKFTVCKEKKSRLHDLQEPLLKNVSACIGFPALVSWMCKQPSDEIVEELLNKPLQSIGGKVVSLKDASTLKERGKYLILAYMSCKDGNMNVNDVDTELFDALKEKYAEGFKYENLKTYARSMKGYYLLENKKCCFELDSNILKKIVFVSVARDEGNLVFFQEHCKKVFSENVTEKCPSNFDKTYAEYCVVQRKLQNA